MSRFKDPEARIKKIKEARAKQIITPEHAAAISRGNTGKKKTEEAKDKIRQKKLGVPRPESTKKKLSEYWMNKKRPELSGENNYNWKGGVNSANMVLRQSIEYKLWRSSVFERDNYKCIWCHSNYRIEADHITPFSIIIRRIAKKNNLDYNKNKRELINTCLMDSELWDKNNGRTLCHKCHQKTDTYLINISKVT